MSDDPKVSASLEATQKGAEATASTASEVKPGSSADAAGEDEVSRLRKEALEAKIWRENKNKEIDDLKRALDSRPTQQYVPPAQGADPRMVQMQEAYVNLQIRAAAGDQDAMLTLAVIESNQMQGKQMADELTISRIPSEDQPVVRQFYGQNRQRFGDPEAAHAFILSERLKKRVTELEGERSTQSAAEAQKRNGVVSVTTRPVAAPEAERVRMTLSEFEARHAQLQAEGKTREAWDLSKKAATGELFRP